MANSTLVPRGRKPDSQPADTRGRFPLFKHATGRWCKKVRGKFVYFGKVADDPRGDAAIKLWAAQKDDLLAGRKPRSADDGTLTVADCCNEFLTFKRARIETGELSPRSFYDYRKTCEKMTATFGRNRAASDLRPDDFEALRKIMAKGRGPIALGGDIIRARMVFGFCFKHGLLDKPMRFGAGFVPPNRKTIRKALASKGPRMFDAADLRKIIDAAGQPMRAMILIAANSGMGNCDVAKLPMRAVDLERGWIDFPREKTATPRRFPLWPETIAAIQDSLLSRPTPKECHEEYVFLTRKRGCWADDSTTGTLGREFAKLVTAAGVKGRTFYDIRRTFQTIGEEAGETATRFIMGHVDGSMSARYRQRIADGRLQAVTDHVRAWLFATAGDNGDGDTPEVKGGGA